MKTQRGAVLVIGLIMLVLLTVVLTGTFALSTSNARATANIQFREEALAAAHAALERVISSPFTDSPATETVLIDIDDDGTNDYTVEVETPVCTGSSSVGNSTPMPSSLSLGTAFQVSTSAQWITEWGLTAIAQDLRGQGTRVVLTQGVYVTLTEAQFNAACPEPAAP